MTPNPTRHGGYRSLFEDLAPLQVDEDALHALGRPGGPCDLGADPAADTDSGVSAVWPFFGQFIAHDITADRSPLVHRADPASLRNFRVPKANLEGIDGAGPVGSPLWLYILKEADVLHDGDRLGPVGGRVVGEVLVGIIDGDPESFRSVDPGWAPMLPARRTGAFGLGDILAPVS